MKVSKRATGIAILALVYVITSIFFVPLAAHFLRFVAADPMTAPTAWLSFARSAPFAGPGMLLADSELRRLWLYLQPVLLAAVAWLLWQPRMRRNRNRIGDGLGGPAHSEYSVAHGSSRWQNAKEINKNMTAWDTRKPAPAVGGIVLGYDERKKRAWLECDDLHTMIIGATRSGKTRRLILPTIWGLAQAGESMILTDPKAELYQRSRDYLKKQGYEVILIDFRDPARGSRWNPLHPVAEAIKAGDPSKASAAAWDISHMIVHQAPIGGDPVWANGEESVIASMILLTAVEAPGDHLKHMGTAYTILYSLGAADADGKLPLNDYITALPAAHLAKAAYGTALLAPYRQRGSFFTGASADLRLFADPAIVHLTSAQDHELDKPGREKAAVFLCIPDEKGTRHILASLYVDQTYQALVDLAVRYGGRLPRRVNFLLDEFGNMPRISDFDKKLTVAAGRGIRFVLVAQDIAQLKRHYRESAQTITGNCATWIYLSTADVETAKLISAKSGQYTIETNSYSSSVRSRDASSGINYSTTGRALLLPDEVLRWPEGMSLLLQARRFPARLPLPDLSRWPADKELITGEEEPRKAIPEPEVWTPNISIGGGVKTAADKTPARASMDF